MGELIWLCSTGKSMTSLERCLKRKPNVNKPNEMGVTPLMWACSSWSVPFVQKLIEEKADVNAEDRNGVRALNFINSEIIGMEDAREQEREDCRKRRLEMEVTGTLMWDRPNVEARRDQKALVDGWRHCRREYQAPRLRLSPHC